MIWLLFVHGLVRPPVGAIYSNNLNFFVLGHQNIHLHILSLNEAKISLDGIINMNEDLAFDISENGDIHFELSHELNRLLRKFYVKIYNARYDTDFAQIGIFIRPIYYKKKVILERSNKRGFLEWTRTFICRQEKKRYD